MKKVFAAIMTMAILALALPPALPRDSNVLPGKSVGRIFLEMQRADVTRSLGKPQAARSLHLGESSGLPVAQQGTYAEDEWVSPQGKSNLDVIYRAGRVAEIITDNPAYVVAGNLSVASPCLALRRRFPDMTVHHYVLMTGDRAPDKIKGVYVDSDNGRGFTRRQATTDDTNEATSFYVDSQKSGVAFEFGVPDSASFADTVATTKPDALLVHEPGVPVLPIYQNFVGKKFEPSDDDELKRLRTWFRP